MRFVRMKDGEAAKYSFIIFIEWGVEVWNVIPDGSKQIRIIIWINQLFTIQHCHEIEQVNKFMGVRIFYQGYIKTVISDF